MEVQVYRYRYRLTIIQGPGPTDWVIITHHPIRGVIVKHQEGYNAVLCVPLTIKCDSVICECNHGLLYVSLTMDCYTVMCECNQGVLCVISPGQWL